MGRCILWACLLLVGCGAGIDDVIPPDRGPALEYRSGCLTFLAEYEIDQPSLDHNVQLATEVLTPIVGDFCAAFEGKVRIRVRAEETWACWGHSNCSGQTWGSGDIHISRRGGSLPHELLHRWDDMHFQPNPGHVSWDTNGYSAALAEWGARGWWRLNPQDYEEAVP